ncbi:MAG: tetratricopeptide repeat protein [Actinobacteria bacterium]|nr:tetratricopeptide repeat protein [Actinomycetota bacterium]
MEETPYSLLQRGKDLLNDGNPAQAATVLERARRMEPDKGSILEVLGRAYYLARRYAEAEACYQNAIRVDPNNDHAHYCLGLCLLKENDKLEAGKHFKLAWSLRPLDDYRFMALRFGAEESGCDGREV